jgi:hypothetical protein
VVMHLKFMLQIMSIPLAYKFRSWHPCRSMCRDREQLEVHEQASDTAIRRKGCLIG